jgi:hypothetical protein
MQQYEPHLTLKVSTEDNYYLVAPHSPKWKTEVMFGAVQIKKNYVSYYLMPLYMYPEMIHDMSRILRRRMHGKSCFNFNKMESDELFAELAAYTARGFERFRVENLP